MGLGCAYLVQILPVLAVAPLYFAGTVQLGVITQARHPNPNPYPNPYPNPNPNTNTNTNPPSPSPSPSPGGDTARELSRRAPRNTIPLVSLRGLILGLGLGLKF